MIYNSGPEKGQTMAIYVEHGMESSENSNGIQGDRAKAGYIARTSVVIRFAIRLELPSQMSALN